MLRIETGRHQKPKFEVSQSTCFCNTDDGLYLMIVWPFHVDELSLLFREIDVEEIDSNDNELFIKIMKNKTTKDIQHRWRFFHECFYESKCGMTD